MIRDASGRHEPLVGAESFTYVERRMTKPRPRGPVGHARFIGLTGISTSPRGRELLAPLPRSRRQRRSIHDQYRHRSSSDGEAGRTPNRRRPRIASMREATSTTPAELIARNSRLTATLSACIRRSGGEFTGVADLHEEDKASERGEQGKKGRSPSEAVLVRPCFQALRTIEKYFSTRRAVLWIRLWADRRMSPVRAT